MLIKRGTKVRLKEDGPFYEIDDIQIKTGFLFKKIFVKVDVQLYKYKTFIKMYNIIEE